MEQTNEEKIPLEDILEVSDMSENEEENQDDPCKSKPFLYYLSEYMDNDTGCETSENEGVSDNDVEDETRAQSADLSKDNSEKESEPEEEEKESNSRRNTVVGG